MKDNIMVQKSQSAPIERKTALCYVRLSVNKNGRDDTSPERQKANILRACEKHGWIPEWFEDTTGHKSATKEQNRPAWLALKARLNDPDVAAIVVNEQSRAMRNAWRAIKLFEELPDYGVVLYLAGAERAIDIRTPDGRMNAYFQAFMDDFYALDMSRRAKDSVQHRKRQNISIGQPPFGTVRKDRRYLVPSPLGAWLMPDGSFKPGTLGEVAPDPNAVWRGYYNCLTYIYELYKDNTHGYIWIADHLNDEGWAFKDRWNNPRPFKGDDVRRITSNWREYAGMVKQGRAKERIANQLENPSNELYDTGRAVLPLDLLHAVAKTQEARSVTKRAPGTKRDAHIFPLSDLLYCAHCEYKALEAEDHKLRSRLIGWNRLGVLRYRHSDTNRCECKRKSIHADHLEQDFFQLVNTLQIHEDAIQIMAEIATQSQFSGYEEADEAKFQEEKNAAIAKHRRALKNLLTLFKAGEIEEEEYYREKDDNERQISYWEARTTDRQQIIIEFTACAELLQRIQQFWEITEGEDRKILAHSLFDEITYDMTNQRIVDFRIKAWAEPFLIMRAALHEDEMGEEMKNRFNGGSGSSSIVSSVDPNGTRTRVLALKGPRPRPLDDRAVLMQEYYQPYAFPSR
jgi:DNA invertase Pin-like site-specific DNA recombinase